METYNRPQIDTNRLTKKFAADGTIASIEMLVNHNQPKSAKCAFRSGCCVDGILHSATSDEGKPTQSFGLIYTIRSFCNSFLIYRELCSYILSSICATIIYNIIESLCM